jgi:hypothetical protein
MPPRRSDEGTGTWQLQVLSAKVYKGLTADQMWRGSRRRPRMRPSCRAGTLYGGPGARALKRR